MGLRDGRYREPRGDPRDGRACRAVGVAWHDVTSSPLLCTPAEKAELEARNALEQLRYLEHVVTRLQRRVVRVSDVLELQRIAVEGIYPCGGRFRDARFDVSIPDSQHKPPLAALVEMHVSDLVEALNDVSSSALRRSALALWRFNWIHPFPGGNGRTARALSYLVLCIDMGQMIPGTPTIPSLIAARRDRYIDALRDVDSRARTLSDASLRSVLAAPTALEPMETLMRFAFSRQLAAAIAASENKTLSLFGRIAATILDASDASKKTK